MSCLAFYALRTMCVIIITSSVEIWRGLVCQKIATLQSFTMKRTVSHAAGTTSNLAAAIFAILAQSININLTLSS